MIKPDIMENVSKCYVHRINGQLESRLVSSPNMKIEIYEEIGGEKKVVEYRVEEIDGQLHAFPPVELGEMLSICWKCISYEKNLGGCEGRVDPVGCFTPKQPERLLRAGIVRLYPNGINSTHFTECCRVAICNDQRCCPKCKREVIGADAETDKERGRIRWKYATAHWSDGT